MYDCMIKTMMIEPEHVTMGQCREGSIRIRMSKGTDRGKDERKRPDGKEI